MTSSFRPSCSSSCCRTPTTPCRRPRRSSATSAWPESLKLVQDLKHAQRSEGRTLQGLVEEIMFGYRRLYDNQCSSLRSVLMQLEQPGTGRVPLAKLRKTNMADFAPNSIWQLSEDTE